MAKKRLKEYLKEYSVKNKGNESYPVYSVTNSKGFCTEYFSKDVSSEDKSSYKIVPRGYFAYNPSRINVGSVDWQNCEDNVIVSPLYTVFKCLDGLNEDYLKYFLKSQKGRKYIDANNSGSVRNSLKFDDLCEFVIDIKSIEEQIIFVEKMKLLDRAIEHENEQILLYDELIEARFIELFGDPVKNPKGWKVKPLLEMGKCKNGMNFSNEESGVEINCLGVGDFKNRSEIFDVSSLPYVSLNEMPAEDYLLKDEDIVFVRSNGNKALVGRSLMVYPGDTASTFSGFCIRFRKNEEETSVMALYLLRVLKMDSMREKMFGRGANIQNLNQKILGKLLIPIPPMEFQVQFADFYSCIKDAKEECKKRIAIYAELYEKLIYECY